MKQDIKLMWVCLIMWIVSLITVIAVSFGISYVNENSVDAQTCLVIIQISASGVFGSAFTLWLTKLFDYKAKKQEILHNYLFKALAYYNVIKKIRPIIDVKCIEDIKKDYAEYNEEKLWNELQEIYVKISLVRQKSKLAIVIENINEYFKQLTAKLDVTFIATQSSQFEDCFKSYQEDGNGLYDVIKRCENGNLILENSSETRLFPKLQELDYYLTGKNNLYPSVFVPTYERDIKEK